MATKSKQSQESRVSARPPKPETAAQVAAFESWFELGRDSAAVLKTSQNFSVNPRTVYEWMTKFDWWTRANKRIDEARTAAEPDRVARVAKALRDQEELGDLYRRKSVEFFKDKKITKASNAINAGIKGIDLTRRALGLPIDFGQQQVDVNLESKVDINEVALLAAMERILDRMARDSATEDNGSPPA